jgi:hypothetical protein
MINSLTDFVKQKAVAFFTPYLPYSNVHIIVCSQNCHILMLNLNQYRMYGGHIMKKPTKRDTINLFFSAFLIIAFIVCAHFFSQYASALSQPLGSIIPILVYAVFGLLVFYATRVGDGKAVKRFSLVTLIVMVLPSLYIIVASLAPGLPLYDVFSNANGSGLSVIVTLASIALGYGIPYSFLSGFEVADDEAVEEETGNPVQGGIEADLADDENAEDTAFEESEEAETEDESESTDETDNGEDA